MKFSLHFGELRRANVWLDDLPAAGFESTERTQISLQAATRLDEQRRAAIELYVPVGPMIIYGLLGGILTPEGPDTLKIEIHTSEDRTKRFEEAMIHSEGAFVGLPREYVPGIQRALAVSGKHVPRLISLGT